MDKLAYSLGLGIGHQLSQMGAKNIEVDDFAQAIKDVLQGSELKMTNTEAQEVAQQFFAKQQEELDKQMAEKGKIAKEEGEKYLKENKEKEGVITLESGLQYTVLTEGSGNSPKATDKVKCHYEGFLIDGSVFDSSVQRGEPATFALNQVITGWTEGLQLMKEGAKYRFFIPYRLAYGERGAGEMIPPFATLIFDVELIQVVK